jgi:hypothetical protein
MPQIGHVNVTSDMMLPMSKQHTTTISTPLAAICCAHCVMELQTDNQPVDIVQNGKLIKQQAWVTMIPA